MLVPNAGQQQIWASGLRRSKCNRIRQSGIYQKEFFDWFSPKNGCRSPSALRLHGGRCVRVSAVVAGRAHDSALVLATNCLVQIYTWYHVQDITKYKKSYLLNEKLSKRPANYSHHTHIQEGYCIVQEALRKRVMS